MENKTVCTSCEIPILKVFAIDTEAGDFCPECCGQDAHHMSLDDMLDLSGAETISLSSSKNGIYRHHICIFVGKIDNQIIYNAFAETANKAFNIAYQKMILQDVDCDPFTNPSKKHISRNSEISLDDCLVGRPS